MKTILVIEHMAKRELTLPTKHWRITERPVIEKADGKIKMLKSGATIIKKDLNWSTAMQILRTEKAVRAHADPQTFVARMERLSL